MHLMLPIADFATPAMLVCRFHFLTSSREKYTIYRTAEDIVCLIYAPGSECKRLSCRSCWKTARSKNILIVAVTQCLRGGVDLGAYAVGTALLDAGVVSGADMTTEAVVAKLAYLFGKNRDPEVRRN